MQLENESLCSECFSFYILLLVLQLDIVRKKVVKISGRDGQEVLWLLLAPTKFALWGLILIIRWPCINVVHILSEDKVTIKVHLNLIYTSLVVEGSSTCSVHTDKGSSTCSQLCSQERSVQTQLASSVKPLHLKWSVSEVGTRRHEMFSLDLVKFFECKKENTRAYGTLPADVPDGSTQALYQAIIGLRSLTIEVIILHLHKHTHTHTGTQTHTGQGHTPCQLRCADKDCCY